ncbi:MAG: hypothetical protein KKG09_03275 [Verrucomicrobia bacterium]|nr:hypothetical protein [Verrucomicrobiota bacterium]MCG2678803.1 hypothetical protein [Kiritimatiellia bacterium]MBU4247001.1 hypothetical protein [Verrucomicrobiota bacterium]MBU4291874.1 hypothetical protein [Verrucomicrobiota bacterium]MBU4427839.1 hypothetical protein [Verrucomicrobiota bacterium]
MKPIGIFGVIGWICLALTAGASDPQVSNVQASQRAGTKLVDITYDVTATGAVSISVAVSTNSGVTYDLPATHFTGDYGTGANPGTGKTIVWDAGADWDGHYHAQMRVQVTANDGIEPVIPPDPATVASTPSNGVATLLYDATSFLYTGANPIQTGVSDGTIVLTRVAVLRGRVIDTNGVPLSGCTVSVNGHPEFGQTVSRTNGGYDMAVNGGASLNINYQKNGYLPLQRTLAVPWQDYVTVDDVALMTTDPNVTVILLPTTNVQSAAGSWVSDADGRRRALAVFPTGVTASIFTYAGATQPVNTLTVKLSEYTVGLNGLNAMPGDLPATVAYTYCVELTAAEAQAKIAGRDVVFNTNIYFYTDNFLGMPAGIQVPVAYYNKDQGAWVPSEDGLVLQLVGTNASGLARVSLSTNGVEADAATLTALGFTDEERRVLAQTYGVCTNSLWRSSLRHFSTYDCNYGIALPTGAEAPSLQSVANQENVNNPNSQGGMGDVELENRVFRETCPLAGTPFRLCYSSERMPGYIASLNIPLTGASLPASLLAMDLSVTVAGVTVTNYFATPTANQSYEFTWNGRDVYGRLVSGNQPVTYQVGYYYQVFYALPPMYYSSFGYVSSRRIAGDIPVRGAQRRLWSEQQTTIGYSPRGWTNDLGGWTLDAHHVYDPVGKMLELGSGKRVRASELRHSRFVIRPYAGDGYTNASGLGRFSGDGGPATSASFWSPMGMAVAPDGAVYVADLNNDRIRRIGTNGIVTTVAGNGDMSYAGDGVAATNTGMYPTDVAVGGDGVFYITDRINHRVYKVGTNGTITTVAGTGNSGFSGDGGTATQAELNDPENVAVGPDGTVFISDWGNHRIRRVAPDGVIMTLAGNGTEGCSGDGGAATNARISPAGLAVGPDGTLTFANTYLMAMNAFRRIGIDGIIRTVAGGGASFYGDGLPATNVQFYSPTDVSFDAQGTLYLADYVRRQVFMVGVDGILKTVAGSGADVWSGDYGPAQTAGLRRVGSVAVAPDGTVYVASFDTHRVRAVGVDFPGVQDEDVLIPDETGNLIYQFNPGGRHLKTYDALTCSNLYSFSYTTNGYLSAVTDGDGNVTTIERDAGGRPAAIEGPFGQRTTLTVNGDGYLATARDPAGATTTYGYLANGLLTSVQGPKGAGYTYTVSYSAAGQVVQANDPAGGSIGVGRASLSNGYQVVSTSGMGCVRSVQVENLDSGDQRRIYTRPDGGQEIRLSYLTGLQSNRMPEGQVTLVQMGPEPRFGMEAPIPTSSVTRLPSGLAMTSLVTRAVVMNGDSSLGLAVQTNWTMVNGKTNVSVYRADTRTLTLRTPEGRQTTVLMDSQGRPLSTQTVGLPTVSNQYDVQGHLTEIRMLGDGSSRTIQYGYDANGYLSEIRSPLDQTNLFEYDSVGRMTRQTFADGSYASYAYDLQGNLTSVTPPGRLAHAFAYNTVDLRSEYTPPIVGGATNATYYTYNADRQLISLRRPGGLTISNTYNAAGQLSTVTIPNTTSTYYWQTNGLLGGITVASGVGFTNEYDGLLVTASRWIGTVTGKVSRTYDNDFRVASMGVNGANTVTYQYDPDSLITQAGSCALSRSADNGLLTGRTLSNVVETLTRNAFGEVTNLTVVGNGTNLFSVSYGYDKLGRITNLTEEIQSTNRSFANTYDAAGRLCQMVTNGTVTNTYQYDSNGNRTNAVITGQVSSAWYDGQDRLLSNSAANYGYNAAGDLTNKTFNGSNTVYQYDALGNLLSVILPTGRTNEYLVDGMNHRVGKKVNGVFTNGFLYAAGVNPVAELDSNTNVLSVFVYGSRANVPDYIIKTGGVYRIVCDHLGSPRLVVQATTGAVVQRLDYDEFGRVVLDTNPGFQPFGFAGGLYDPDTGLVRFGARDYDPETGRWTAKDPILFAGASANLYCYADNNPVNEKDIAGLGPQNDIVNWGADITSLPGVPLGSVASGVQVVNTAYNVSQGTDTMTSYVHDSAMLISGAAVVFGPYGQLFAASATWVDMQSQVLFRNYFDKLYGNQTASPLSSNMLNYMENVIRR